MSTIELFEFPDMKGDSHSLTDDTPDLAQFGFLKRAQSIRVIGEPWVVFTDSKYQGQYAVFKEGIYSSIPGFSKSISSTRIVKGGLYEPKITVYEHINYGGRAQVLLKDADSLKTYGMETMVSSHKVDKGAWVLYQGDFFTGKTMVTIAGDSVPDYTKIDWNDKANSVKAIKAYQTYQTVV
ncbi:hypothetical protein XELAEV_18007316mg [Xenopus laevis]|uniref:Beta/gamma crystallin 'Greek key' domain-containing protein n=1 Tax=Xenopus laevis TaxID=8355 RepID=A0A974I4L6_XENLA|nr:hypothetical protein XELAEV_18007316mg [Xenopus laevis]